MVDSKCVASLFLFLFEALWNMKILESEYGSRIGAIPGQGYALHMPWEYAALVGSLKILDRELISERDDIAGVIKVILNEDPFRIFVL